MDEGDALYQRGMDLRYRGKAPTRLHRKKKILEPAWVVEEEEARSFEALDCFERSYKLGNAGGKYEFAVAILDRKFPITEEASRRYSDEAVDLLLESAEGGHRAAMIRVGMVELGYFLKNDNPSYRKIPLNPHIAINRLEKCIPDSNALSVLESQFELGGNFSKDLTRALTYELLRISLNPTSVGQRSYDPSRISYLKSKMTESDVDKARYKAEQMAKKRHQYSPIRIL